MHEHGSIVYTKALSEIEYLSTLSKVVVALYFPVSLVNRELLFFSLVLYCLRRGYSDVATKEFKEVFDQHYFQETATKTQKASHFCTVRKNLINKKLIHYNKNTGVVSVSEAWKHKFNNMSININLGLTISA